MGEEGRALAERWAEDEGDGLREAMGGYENNLIVTPQDIDALVARTAKLLSEATNLAVHRGLDREQIHALTGV
jgi:hypothetical protein